MVHLVERRRTGNLRCAIDDHLADLALAMDLQYLDGSLPVHPALPLWTDAFRLSLARTVRRHSRRLGRLPVLSFPPHSVAAADGGSRRPRSPPARSHISPS